MPLTVFTCFFSVSVALNIFTSQGENFKFIFFERVLNWESTFHSPFYLSVLWVNYHNNKFSSVSKCQHSFPHFSNSVNYSKIFIYERSVFSYIIFVLCVLIIFGHVKFS